MTADLVAFLHARLNDDEQTARHAFGDHNEASPTWSEPTTGVVDTGAPGLDGLIAIGDGPIARHIARHDPARVLAEVDTKRRILARYTSAVEDAAEDSEGYFDENRFEDARQLRPVLRLLALPHADHPDYREEWRPAP